MVEYSPSIETAAAAQRLLAAQNKASETSRVEIALALTILIYHSSN